MNFMGYLRPDGSVGTRNLIAVLPTVFCANHVANRIASHVSQACSFPHPVGCGYPGPDQQITAHILHRIAMHPNFGAVLFVGLGCERVRPEDLEFQKIKKIKPVHFISIQEEGDSLKTIEKGKKLVAQFASQLQRQQRTEVPASKLILGLKCGGTDAASGMAANPALGVASDLLLENGGSAILTEITELCGTEHIMSSRARTPEVATKIVKCVEKNVRQLNLATRSAHETIGQTMLVSPGNADGGVSNVVEKALGGLKKAGNGIFQDVTEYGAPLPGRGLYLMDGPGHDGEAVTGLICAGAQVVVFTTGRGTPAGFPGIPVIKATGSPVTANLMRANIDFNAGRLFTEGLPLSVLGRELLDTILETASGKLTTAEQIGHEELFCISRFMPERQLCSCIE